MNNYAIARVFTRIADLMELKGENPFKIRAYRTAAQVMQETTESLEVLAERDALQSIPGVGEAISAKTRQIIATGTCDLLERLKTEVPETLTELLALPGLGSKKIHALWQELGVAGLDALEQAAAAHRLRGVAGFAEKSEAKLLESIAAHRRRSQRIPIGSALPYAEALVRMLLETGAFSRILLTGSLARWSDTVGDIDLIAVADNAVAALDAFCGHSEVREVLERQEDLATIRSQNGMPVTLKVADETSLAEHLQVWTGSAAHLRDLAEFDTLQPLPPVAVPPGSPPDAPAYARRGLPWIPPELREGRGEVQAAVEGRLPRLIRHEDLRGILHAHSTWSDGLASIPRMAAAAREAGYAYHGNTDHSKALAVTGGLDEERLVAQMAEIDALNATFTDGFRVLRGIECDILLDGTLDLPIDLLNRLDIVIASVHMHQRLDEETMTRRIIRALESGVVDLLAHPTGRILGMRDPYPVDLERVMDAAIANQVALEINAYPDRLDLNDVQARRAKERGLLISVNTDAHRPEHLTYTRYGIAQARRAWLEPEDVINTWPLDHLLAWLQRRER